MMYQMRLAKASQPEAVRKFAEAVDALLDAANPELVSCGRGHTHSMSRGRVETGIASYEVPRTRRTRVTFVTAQVCIGPGGAISGECECAGTEHLCEHLVAAFIKLVDYVAEDDRRLMRLQGMSDDQIEAVEESRRPGRTRWAASAYTDGPSPAAAFAQIPGPLPKPPQVPRTAAALDYSEGAYSLDSLAGGISIRALEQQAALAADAALAALIAIDDADSGEVRGE